MCRRLGKKARKAMAVRTPVVVERKSSYTTRMFNTVDELDAKYSDQHQYTYRWELTRAKAKHLQRLENLWLYCKVYDPLDANMKSRVMRNRRRNHVTVLDTTRV